MHHANDEPINNIKNDVQFTTEEKKVTGNKN